MMFSFPSEVVVTMNKVEGHPSPPEDFQKKMMVALKDFFNEKLEEEPWCAGFKPSQFNIQECRTAIRQVLQL